MNVRPLNSAYASSTSTSALRSSRRNPLDRARRNRQTRRVVRIGEVDQPRVGAIAASIASSGNRKSGSGCMCIARSPTPRRTPRTFRRPVRRSTARGPAAPPPDQLRDDVQPFVESVRELHPARIDAEVLLGRRRDGLVVWVEADVFTANRSQRLQNGRRTARGVLVEVKPKARGGRRLGIGHDSLNLYRLGMPRQPLSRRERERRPGRSIAGRAPRASGR